MATADGSLGHRGSVLDLVLGLRGVGGPVVRGRLAVAAGAARRPRARAAAADGRRDARTEARRRQADRPGSPEARRKAFLQVVPAQVVGCAAGTCLGCAVLAAGGVPQRVCREGPSSPPTSSPGRPSSEGATAGRPGHAGRSGRRRSGRSGRRSGRRSRRGRPRRAACRGRGAGSRDLDGRHRRAARGARRGPWTGARPREPAARGGRVGGVRRGGRGRGRPRAARRAGDAGHDAQAARRPRGTRTADVPAGLLVGIGLQNPGIDAVLERYAPTWARWPVPVIVNLCGESAGDVADMARRLEGVPGVAGIELNLSCANGGRAAFGLDEGAAGFPRDGRPTGDGAADHREADGGRHGRAGDREGGRGRRRRRHQRDQHDAGPGALRRADAPALASGYGGICGPALKPHGLRVVWEVAQAVDVPVIGIGGVSVDRRRARLSRRRGVGRRRGRRGARGPDAPRASGGRAGGRVPGSRPRVGQALVGTALPPKPSPPSTRGAEYGR